MSAAESVVGAAWTTLPAAIRSIHQGSEAVGEGSVLGPETVFLRGLGWLLRLPPAAERVRISLQVEPRPSGEVWRRRFGAYRLDTCVGLRGGLFAERFRGIELRFGLAADGDSLRFMQHDAALVLGPLRIPLPAALGPRIAAHDEPGATPDRVTFAVELSLWGRRLVRYAGWVTVADRE